MRFTKSVFTQGKAGRWMRCLSVLGAAAVALWTTPASATHCPCESQICTPDGFLKTLTDFHVDALKGTSSWTYELCVAAADGTCSNDGTSCQDNQDCWRNRCQTGGPNAGTCSQDDTTPCTNDKDCNVGVVCSGGANNCRVDKFQNLSHIDVLLPDVGTCLGENQSLSIRADCTVDCPADLICRTVSDRDPSCSIAGTQVLKCDVGDNDIDPGECVKIIVEVAGEVPTLGPGAIDEVTKVAQTCTTDQICGPACDCAEPAEECLTRTAGFWGTHPHITAQFDPIIVCGKTLDTTDAGVCNSDSEALCVAPGGEANRRCDRNPAYASLVRQLAAAKLNLNASVANGGDCGAAIAARIAECEAKFCGASQSRISGSGCIEDLDAFNNSQDTFAITPAPFDSPGPADPTQCTAANGNGLVIGKLCTVDCR